VNAKKPDTKPDSTLNDRSISATVVAVDFSQSSAVQLPLWPLALYSSL
jgi:hypothetical protein